MRYPKKSATHNHEQLGLLDKGHAKFCNSLDASTFRLTLLSIMAPEV